MYRILTETENMSKTAYDMDDATKIAERFYLEGHSVEIRDDDNNDEVVYQMMQEEDEE